jgi:hypothetical protein
MSDGPDTPGVTTNGSGRVASPDAPERPTDGPGHFSDHSIAERLDALRQTVETWDWRAPPARSRPLAARDPEAPGVTDTTTERREPSNGPVVVPAAPSTPRVHEPEAAAAPTVNETQVVPVVLTASAPPADVAPEADVARLHAPFVADPLPADAAQLPSEDESVPPVASVEPVPVPEPEVSGPPPDGLVGLLHQAWSHRATKMAVLCVAAVVAVVVIIWGIRMAHSSPGSDTPSSTTATTAAQSASKQTPHTAFVLPVTTAQLAQYEQYAQGLEKGNAAATKVFVSSGNAPPAAQLAAPVAAYRSAVNLYDFDLRFIQWPASMQAAVAADHTQLEVLVNFLQTFATEGTSNVTGWLSGLHIRGGAAQTTDNQVRQDLGLPALSSFP